MTIRDVQGLICQRDRAVFAPTSSSQERFAFQLVVLRLRQESASLCDGTGRTCLQFVILLFALLDSDTRRAFAMSDGFFKFALPFDLLMKILFDTSIRQPKDTEKNISPLDRRRRQGQALGSTSCTVLFRDSVLPFRMDRRHAPTLRG